MLYCFIGRHRIGQTDLRVGCIHEIRNWLFLMVQIVDFWSYFGISFYVRFDRWALSIDFSMHLVWQVRFDHGLKTGRFSHIQYGTSMSLTVNLHRTLLLQFDQILKVLFRLHALSVFYHLPNCSLIFIVIYNVQVSLFFLSNTLFELLSIFQIHFRLHVCCLRRQDLLFVTVSKSYSFLKSDFILFDNGMIQFR